jgi:hypothetical protein
MNLVERIAHRYLTTSIPDAIQDLKRATDGLNEDDTYLYIDSNFNRIGKGAESYVYEISDDTVVKVSNPKNMRGEYVIFADPKFESVTPGVKGHHPKWYWIAVERVEEITSWKQVFENLPSFEEVFGGRESSVFDLAEAFQDVLLELDGQLTTRDIRDKWDQLSEDDRRWFQQIAELHKTLDVEIVDIGPGNLGVTRDWPPDLVLIDIHIP